jgi:hypothetical protein
VGGAFEPSAKRLAARVRVSREMIIFFMIENVDGGNCSMRELGGNLFGVKSHFFVDFAGGTFF